MRKTSPPLSLGNSLPKHEPQVITLSNGIKLYAVNAGTQEVVKVSVVFGAGSRHQQQKLTANATLGLLNEGTQNLSAQQVAEGFDFLGSHYEQYMDKDYAQMSVYSLTKNLDKTLDILRQMVLQPKFANEELHTYIAKQKQRLQIEQERIVYLAQQHFSAAIYGPQYPYGVYAVPTDYDALQSSLLVDFHRRFYTAENCFIVAVGKIEDAHIACIAKHFEQIPRGEKLQKAVRAEVRDINRPPQTLLIEKPQALQSALRYGKVLFSKNHPDYAAMHILCVILGGYMGSRLMKNIREEKGYTYGIFAAMVNHELAGHFVIGAEVGSEFTRNTLVEIEREIDLLCSQKVSEDELQLVKQYLNGEIARSLDGAWALSEVTIENIQHHLSRSYAEILFEETQQITSEKLLSLAQKYLNKVEMSSLVVGQHR